MGMCTLRGVSFIYCRCDVLCYWTTVVCEQLHSCINKQHSWTPEAVSVNQLRETTVVLHLVRWLCLLRNNSWGSKTDSVGICAFETGNLSFIQETCISYRKPAFHINAFQSTSNHEINTCADQFHAVVQLVEALPYMSEGRGFDSRWCHWNCSLTFRHRASYI
jgi:hypothetical protein